MNDYAIVANDEVIEEQLEYEEAIILAQSEANEYDRPVHILKKVATIMPEWMDNNDDLSINGVIPGRDFPISLRR